jgi:hypothetical protein
MISGILYYFIPVIFQYFAFCTDDKMLINPICPFKWTSNLKIHHNYSFIKMKKLKNSVFLIINNLKLGCTKIFWSYFQKSLSGKQK